MYEKKIGIDDGCFGEYPLINLSVLMISFASGFQGLLLDRIFGGGTNRGGGGGGLNE